MSSKVDIQLIIAYVDGELSSPEREKVQMLIQSDEDWFISYLDIKSTKEELDNIQLEVTPDVLKVYKEENKQSNSSFSLNWLLSPQIAIGSACILLVIVFYSIQNSLIIPSDDMDTQFSTTRSVDLNLNIEDVGNIEIENGILKISNSSNNELILFLNQEKYEISIQGDYEIELDARTNRIVVVNSFMDTVIDTTILIDE